MTANAQQAPPVPQQRRQSADSRRRELLAATVSCLARLGPRRTTGREICRQAGVSHGLLRHYFKNPDNLLLETYEALCARFLAYLEGQIAGQGAGSRKALDHYLAAVFSEEWASREIIGAWIIFWQLVRRREDFAAVSDSFNQRQRELLATLLGQLGLAPAVPMDDAVAILSATVDGLWIEHYLSAERMPAARCVALAQHSVALLFPA